MTSSTTNNNNNSFTPPLVVSHHHNKMIPPKSVMEVCDGLWSVQDVYQANSWLKLLYETILHSNQSNNMTVLDPSETFLCVQGAALRFPESTEIWELALWCTAALSRVCIGPAWRLQRHSYYNVVTQTTQTTTEGDSTTTSIESMSPRLFSSQSQRSAGTLNHDNLNDHHGTSSSYPYIPQVLPGAILRFAASAPATDRRLAEAQRELVLSLVCPSEFAVDSERESSSSSLQQHQHHQHAAVVEWSIPGVHETIQSMVLFWIQQTARTRIKQNCQDDGDNNAKHHTTPSQTKNANVDANTTTDDTTPSNWLDDIDTMITQNPQKQPTPSEHKDFLQRLQKPPYDALDWWYTLKVARACSDLVSTGWRPDTSILSLCWVHIAQQGISLSHISPKAVDRETREERLAAISSAAEAMAALASLGSKGWFCPSRAIVLRLLELQLATTPSHDNLQLLYPIPEADHPEEIWLREREEFISQRSSCFADTADLLWVLLAQERTFSSELVMSTLLEQVTSKKSDPVALDEERASVIVRIVSWALWGKPPSMRGIPSLRVYWIEFMEILKHLVSQCFPSRRSQGMALALEIVVALRRLAQTELLQGSGILIREEWIVLEEILSNFIIVSLRLTSGQLLANDDAKKGTTATSTILKHIQSESDVLLCQFGEYLDRCSLAKYHFIVDDERRNTMHDLLLRQAASLVQETRNGTQLAISVLNSSAAIGFQANRRHEWLSTAQSIMAEAFAIDDSDDCNYVHSPLVRLEALRLLTMDPTKDQHHLNNNNSVMEQQRRSSKKRQRTSPLTLLTNFPEEYLEMVQTMLLPYLDLVLDNDGRQLETLCTPSHHVTAKVYRYCENFTTTTTLQQQQEDNAGTTKAELIPVDFKLKHKLSRQSSFFGNGEKVIQDLFDLCKYAVELTGTLYCNDNIQKPLRLFLLSMLEEIAIFEKDNTEEKPKATSEIKKQQHESSVLTTTTRSLLSLEAVGQLERCLCAPFFSFPHTHDSIPATIQILCSILDHYTAALSYDNTTAKQQQQKPREYSQQILLFAALSPLARLRRAQDGDLLLVEREKAVLHLPDGIETTLLYNKRDTVSQDDLGSFIAPFARVDNIFDTAQEDDITLVSFQPIIESLVKILSSPCCLTSSKLNTTSTRKTAGTSSVNSDEESESDKKNLQKRFRSCCYDTILSYTLSGLSFPKLNLVATLISSPVSEGAYSGMENFTRIRASIAALQCSILSSSSEDPSKACPSSANMENLKSLVENLLPLCGSCTPEEAINGCSLLLGLFPSIIISCGNNMEFLRSMLHLVVMILSSCARGYLEQMALSTSDPLQKITTAKQLDHGPSILFCLYGSILYYFDHFSNLEFSDSQRLVRLCYDVASASIFSRSCRTFAVRCAVSVLDRMDQDNLYDIWSEYSSLQQIGEDDRSLCCVSTASQLEIPDSDQILCALQYKLLRLMNPDNSCTMNTTGSRQAHVAMAEEVENMRSFDTTKEAVAAWLFGDSQNHLLTCKVGGKNSRNCGWVEICVRGACFRNRQLIRLTQSASVEKPELPSPLWNQTPINYANNSLVTSKKEENTLMMKPIRRSPRLIEDALALLERSEQMLGAGNNRPGESSSHAENEFGQREPSLRSLRRIPSSDDSLTSFTNHYYYGETTEAVPPVPEQIDTFDQSSLKCWLQEVLRDDIEVEDVTKQLSSSGLGFMVESEPENGGIPNKASIIDPIVRLRFDSKAERSINFLERTVPINTHKIALLYASPHFAQDKGDETEIDCYLKVQAASPSFFNFTRGLGELVLTKHLKYFSAGIDTSGNDTDGEFALIWIEDVNCTTSTSKCLTIYHAVPFMPQNLNNRKRHVGNDCVHIIFADPASYLHERLWADGPEEEMENSLIGGQFGFVTIFVIPVNDEAYRVKVQLKPGLPETIWLQLQHLPGEHMLPKDEAPGFVRRLANLADIACAAATNDNFGPPNNWEIRLSQLRLMMRHAQ